MTDHPTPFDPAALLDEWTRVHGLTRPARWAADSGGVVYIDDGSEHPDFVCEPSGYRASEPERRLCIDEAVAIAHYHNTYGALLDVARGLVALLDQPQARDPHWLMPVEIDALLAPLSRLDAAGGGR